MEAEAFRKAIVAAHTVFEQAKVIGYNLDILDIGGGFPGYDQPEINFDDITRTINASIDELFPKVSGVRIIAEPGRYYAASAYTLTANVIAKRQVESDLEEDKAKLMYFINDGVYGSFNCLLYDHADVKIDYIKVNRMFLISLQFQFLLMSLFVPKSIFNLNLILIQDVDKDATFNSSLWGPTCDGLDCIFEESQMPLLDVGDWVYFKNMGAYTLAAGSTFNGMPRPKVYYFIEDTQWMQMLVMMATQNMLKEFDVAKAKAKKIMQSRMLTLTSSS